MMKKIIFSLFLLLFILINIVYSQSGTAEIRYEDKIRIKEAVNIFNIYGNKLWNGWDKAPFAILLVTNEKEYMINYDEPSSDFKITEYDTVLNRNIYSRPRKFSTNLLATFPAVNGIFTIVVGQPENTGLSSAAWTITLLHEHFHQFQYTQPGYQESVNSLDLAGGDSSGMWMLNYPFPYDNDLIAAQYKALTLAAKDAAFAETDFETKMKIYLMERETFKKMLNEKDYRYFSFQLWQEGIARYSEVKIAEMVRGNYVPSAGFTNLDDYRNIDSFYTDITNKLKRRADMQDLKENRRDCLYTLGAFEGLILDKVNPNWRDLYFKEKFYIEKYYNLK